MTQCRRSLCRAVYFAGSVSLLAMRSLCTSQQIRVEFDPAQTGIAKKRFQRAVLLPPFACRLCCASCRPVSTPSFMARQESEEPRLRHDRAAAIA